VGKSIRVIAEAEQKTLYTGGEVADMGNLASVKRFEETKEASIGNRIQD